MYKDLTSKKEEWDPNGEDHWSQSSEEEFQSTMAKLAEGSVNKKSVLKKGGKKSSFEPNSVYFS
jgi:hypothetical protein